MWSVLSVVCKDYPSVYTSLFSLGKKWILLSLKHSIKILKIKLIYYGKYWYFRIRHCEVAFISTYFYFVLFFLCTYILFFVCLHLKFKKRIKLSPPGKQWQQSSIEVGLCSKQGRHTIDWGYHLFSYHLLLFTKCKGKCKSVYLSHLI